MKNAPKIAPTRHGRRSTYTRGCHCAECAAAQRAYSRNYYRLYRSKVEGVPHIDPQRARQHVAELQATGMGVRAIAHAAGVTRSTVTELAAGRRVRGIRPATATAILAVNPAPRYVDATGATRRARALAALGWTARDVATAADLNPRVVGELLAAARPSVTRATSAAICLTYDRLSMRCGPSQVARRRAIAKGWPPPLAWDDDAIDDPATTPLHKLRAEPGSYVDDAAVARRAAGDMVPITRAERWAVVARLHAQGLSDGQIALRAHLVDRQVLRDRQTLGLPANTPKAGDHSARVAS